MKPPRWLETVLWSAGLVLLIACGAVWSWAELARREGVRALGEIRSAHAIAAARRGSHTSLIEWQPSTADQSLWSESRIRAFREGSFRDAPLGVLRIPALALEVPVYGNTSEINLNRGAGHIAGTAAVEAVGNVGIAAHRDGFFRKLNDAHAGQLLYLDTPTRTHRYRVVDIRIVNPSDVAVLAPTAVPSITLVTCYPFYYVGSAPQRFIVRAEIDEGAAVRWSSTGSRVQPGQE